MGILGGIEMNWVVIAGIFCLGGLFGLLFMSLFVVASDRVQKPPVSELKEERPSNPEFPFRKAVGD